MPPMGLSFGDLGAIDKTPSKLYPVRVLDRFTTLVALTCWIAFRTVGCRTATDADIPLCDHTLCSQELTTIPKLSDPSEKEIRDADYLLKYLDEQRNSPYWPVEIEKKFKGTFCFDLSSVVFD